MRHGLNAHTYDNEIDISYIFPPSENVKEHLEKAKELVSSEMKRVTEILDKYNVEYNMSGDWGNVEGEPQVWVGENPTDDPQVFKVIYTPKYNWECTAIDLKLNGVKHELS